MKSFLIIGMSTFGQHLLKELARLGCDVMIADIDGAVIEPMLPYSVSAKICDCTNPEVLKSFGVDEFDTCFVCLGGNFTETLEVSYLLKELHAKNVITEVNRDIESKFVLRNGADSAVYPEKDTALRIAARESSDSVFDAIKLSDGYSVYETVVPAAWIGKSVKELDLRVRYNVNIIALKEEETIKPMLSPDHKFSASEHILMMCHESDIKKLFKK